MHIITKLATPILVSPADGQAVTVDAAVPFKWDPVAGASGYYLEVQYYDDQTWKVLKTANADSRTHTVDVSHGYDQGRWRVTAMDSSGAHTSSDPSGWSTYLINIRQLIKK